MRPFASAVSPDEDVDEQLSSVAAGSGVVASAFCEAKWNDMLS